MRPVIVSCFSIMFDSNSLFRVHVRVVEHVRLFHGPVFFVVALDVSRFFFWSGPSHRFLEHATFPGTFRSITSVLFVSGPSHLSLEPFLAFSIAAEHLRPATPRLALLTPLAVRVQPFSGTPSSESSAVQRNGERETTGHEPLYQQGGQAFPGKRPVGKLQIGCGARNRCVPAGSCVVEYVGEALELEEAI